MVKLMHLYLDDTGTRNPDRKSDRLPAHGRDWFGLGGVLVKEEDEQSIRDAHDQFMMKWELDPSSVFLHSSEIRNKTGQFTWIAKLEKREFDLLMGDLNYFLTSCPVLGFACVIDRPGYRDMYFEKYGRQTWSLCKTAFAIVLERATKYAMQHQSKLRVYVERSDKITDRKMKDYYLNLKKEGMPFQNGGRQVYTPLTADELNSSLYEFRTKDKKSSIMQIADLYLWPMAIGGYDPDNVPYKRLMDASRIIDSVIPEDQKNVFGVKYSCFKRNDGSSQRKQSPE